MTPFEQQLEILTNDQKGVACERLPDGSYLISIPAVPLRAGWSKESVTVKFIAPVGYPFAPPDCFWTDGDLRIKQSGAVPQSTGANPIPHKGGGFLWFSWHVSTWNPNVDNLVTYLRVIKRRLDSVQ